VSVKKRGDLQLVGPYFLPFQQNQVETDPDPFGHLIVLDKIST
jgi:hypothetical protein